MDSASSVPSDRVSAPTLIDAVEAREAPPLQLSPVTSDPDEAREWLNAFKTTGAEGLLVKGASTRYQPRVVTG